jgi:hypothetical protein
MNLTFCRNRLHLIFSVQLTDALEEQNLYISTYSMNKTKKEIVGDVYFDVLYMLRAIAYMSFIHLQMNEHVLWFYISTIKYTSIQRF